MAKKCPPGVFCIENMTLISVVLILGVFGFIVYRMFSQHLYGSPSVERTDIIVERDSTPFYMKPATFFSNLTADVFLNPFAPPLKENRFFPGSAGYVGNQIEHGIRGGRGGIPINVSTSQYDVEYKQVGILTRQSGAQTILPIFGRPLHSNRNKWQYYSMTENNNMIKLPISRGGRSCTDDYGCDELFSGDNVYVEGYKDNFIVTIYENSKPRYIPYV